MRITAGDVRQPFHARTVGANGVKLEASIAVAGKEDDIAMRLPLREVVVMRSIGQRDRFAISETADHELFSMPVNNLRAIGRPTREPVIDTIVDDDLVIRSIRLDGRNLRCRES